jgi:hypothetical protein
MKGREKKPKEYWNDKKNCSEVAALCSSRSEFKRKYSSAYRSSTKNGWLDEICGHMVNRQKPAGYWNDKNKCAETAALCLSLNEFRKKYPTVYAASIRNGWMNDICKHMINCKKPLGYWSDKQNCSEAAALCVSHIEFRKKYSAAYKSCLKNGWLDELCKHMISHQRPRGFWQNIENCKEAARQCKTMKEFRAKFGSAYHACLQHNWFDIVCPHLEVLRDIYKWANEKDIIAEARKYATRREFQIKNGSAYQAALRLGILDKACAHIPKKRNFSQRGIYAFEFSDNCVYVGLTYNFADRKCNHLANKDSKVYQHISQTGLTPVFKILHNYIDMKLAADLEGEFLNDYIERGWIPLNVQKTGNLGGSSPFYTHKRVLEIAHSCKTLVEFRTNYDQAYQAARKHRWLAEIKKFLPASVNQYGDFKNTYEEVMAYARECKTYREFSLGNPSAAAFAKRNDFIEEIHKLLPPTIKAKSINKLTIENVLECANNCSNYLDFQKKYATAYNAARRNGWLTQVKAILPPITHRPYTKDEVLSVVKTCKTYSDFLKTSSSMYNSALRNGWLNEIRQYFGQKSIHTPYTLNEVLTIAKECNNYKDFTSQVGAYTAARKNGWLDDVKEILKPDVHECYTKESVIQIATSCKTYQEFQTQHTGAYRAARVNNWLIDIEQILPRKQSRPYTKEQVLELAKSFATMRDFYKKYPYACKAAYRNGWKENLLKILSLEVREPYSKEEVLAIAERCSSYKQFRTEYASAYVVARIKGWLEDIQQILPIKTRKPFTKEEILSLASNCENYSNFCKIYKQAYKAATKKKMLDELKLFFKTRKMQI